MLHRIPIVVNDPWENYNPYFHASARTSRHSSSASSAPNPRTVVEPVTLAQIKANAPTEKVDITKQI